MPFKKIIRNIFFVCFWCINYPKKCILKGEQEEKSKSIIKCLSRWHNFLHMKFIIAQLNFYQKSSLMLKIRELLLPKIVLIHRLKKQNLIKTNKHYCKLIHSSFGSESKKAKDIFNQMRHKYTKLTVWLKFEPEIL